MKEQKEKVEPRKHEWVGKPRDEWTKQERISLTPK